MEPEKRHGWHRHPNGNGWVQDSAWVDHTAFIGPNAEVLGEAVVLEKASVCGHSRVCGNARVMGYAKVRGTAVVSGRAQVFGQAKVLQQAKVMDNAAVGGDAVIGGFACVRDGAFVNGSAYLWDQAVAQGSTHMTGSMTVDRGKWSRPPLHIIGLAPWPITESIGGVHIGCQFVPAEAQVEWLVRLGQKNGMHGHEVKQLHHKMKVLELMK